MTNNTVEVPCEAVDGRKWDGRIELVQGRRVEGWASQLSDPIKLLEVEILCNGNIIGAGPADRYRADLLSAGIGDGRHGFAIDCEVDLTADLQVRIAGTDYILPLHADDLFGLETGGLPSEALIVKVEVARVTPRGILEISGWAAGYSPLQQIEVFVGDTLVGQPELNRPRLDVKEAHPEFSNAANSGFLLLVAANDEILAQSEVSVTARMVGGVTRCAFDVLQRPAVMRRKPLRGRRVQPRL